MQHFAGGQKNTRLPKQTEIKEIESTISKLLYEYSW